jgi:multidrug efflux pump subunit AcrB
MNLTDFSLKNPYTVTALVLVVAALGGFAFFRTPTDLFPNTVPPQVIVITVRPGANADDMSDKVSELIEKELNTLIGLKMVISTSRDEV